MKNIFSQKFFAGAALAAVLAASPAFADSYNSGTASSGDWAGPYAGLHVGGMWGNFRHDGVVGPSGTTDSLMGGGQVGYNWQYNQLVYGLEGDFSKMDVGHNTGAVNFDEDWMSTVRGRMGWAVGRFLPYGTMGVAMTDSILRDPGFGTDSAVETGIAAGGGIDTQLSDKWVGRIEYLYTEVPRNSTAFAGTNVSGGSHNDILRFGLNYKF